MRVCSAGHTLAFAFTSEGKWTSMADFLTLTEDIFSLL